LATSEDDPRAQTEDRAAVNKKDAQKGLPLKKEITREYQHTDRRDHITRQISAGFLSVAPKW